MLTELLRFGVLALVHGAVHLPTIRHANLYRHFEASLGTSSSNGNTSTLWFEQKLDHFTGEDARFFQQRYYLNFDHYAPSGPIFVFIGGEGALTAGSVENGEIVENAKVHGAAVVGLEHRYYGLSNPFSTHETANLRWLSSQQALADLANWLAWLRYEQGWSAEQVQKVKERAREREREI
jgi:hypothetical protein